MRFKNNAFEQLENRGFVFQTTNLEETKRILSEGGSYNFLHRH